MYKHSVSALLLTTASLLLSTALSAPAQSTGNNAVYSPSLTYSAAFIDASVFPGTDVCAKLNYLYVNNKIPTAGAVVDARGAFSGSTQNCSVMPFSGTLHPATILLPSGTITISSTWVLPNQTRIVGEGVGKTTIQAVSGFSGNMIQMAPTTGCPTGGCTAVSVEELTLDGNGQSVAIGISNSNAQGFSYVRRVLFYQITGKGLVVSTPNAKDSGPYSELEVSSGSLGAPSTGTVCVQISGTSTRGIHGLTCVSNGTPLNGVLIDASNNSIEDVYVSGFKDGVVLGKNNTAQGDVLFNITGSNANGTMNQVIHICNSASLVSPCLSSTAVVNDVSIMAVSSGGATNSIRDDLTGAILTDASVAFYALGEKVTTNGAVIGYSRFTTSLNTTSWVVGGGIPTGSCKTGSLFSNTGGTNNTTWYVCENSGWTPITSM